MRKKEIKKVEEVVAVESPTTDDPNFGFCSNSNCGKRLPIVDFKSFKGENNEYKFCSIECYNK